MIVTAGWMQRVKAVLQEAPRLSDLSYESGYLCGEDGLPGATSAEHLQKMKEADAILDRAKDLVAEIDLLLEVNGER